MKHLFFLTKGLTVLAILFVCQAVEAQDKSFYTTSESGALILTKAGASHFAQLALHCVDREFPYKDGHVAESEDDVKRPSELHPAFYGCFDWHSSVHGHWMLIRLLKTFPDLPEGDQIRKVMRDHLTPEKMLIEKSYFERKMARSFERTYGWAWMLKLAEELYSWDDPEAKVWYAAVKPLSDLIAGNYITFLPKLSYPNRTGEHPNTAFGMTFAWDFAVTTDHAELRTLLKGISLKLYQSDLNCPEGYEPSGYDFLSPCLEEADLMRRTLSAEEFGSWLEKFLPGLTTGQTASLSQPAKVTDRSDGKLVHLDGLNLSRAWCLYGIASSLPNGAETLIKNANHHLEVTIPQIASGEYSGEHWLASFAVYALTSQLNE